MTLFRRLLEVGVVLFVLTAALLPVSAHAQQANAFSILSFEGDYYLSKTEDKRSHMRITEKIVVEFPPYDQNHGIERSIPQQYDGRKVAMTVSSVKDDKGKTLTYRTYDYNKNTVVRIGDANKYIHGKQTYVLNYEVSDVTKNVANKSDELFWDTNGTDWGQTFGSVTARLHLGSDLSKAFDGRSKCIEGSQGSTSKCTTAIARNNGQTTIAFTSSRMLYAGENVSLVAGFAKNTFAPYKPTLWERTRGWLIGFWLISGAVAFAFAAVKMRRAWEQYGRSPEGKGVIVPEYVPPKDLTILKSAAILKRKASDETAQIIDLAVRHYLKIYETETKGSWFKSKKTYEIELTKAPLRLKSEERQLLTIIFGDKLEVGQRVIIEALSSKLYKDAEKLQKAVESSARSEGYIADMAAARKRYYWIGGSTMLGGLVLLNPGVLFAGLMIAIVAAMFHPLTEKGVISRDYLRGLEMYMKLAEAERMKVLQSPEGATKSTVDPGNKKKLVRLYEKLLPYAIVFGLEKEWAKEFASLQPAKAPDWYVGNWTTFNAAAFAGSLSGFTHASNTSFAAPTDSSASGFSSGGSSGGGGGGGGGGGW